MQPQLVSPLHFAHQLFASTHLQPLWHVPAAHCFAMWSSASVQQRLASSMAAARFDEPDAPCLSHSSEDWPRGTSSTLGGSQLAPRSQLQLRRERPAQTIGSCVHLRTIAAVATQSKDCSLLGKVARCGAACLSTMRILQHTLRNTCLWHRCSSQQWRNPRRCSGVGVLAQRDHVFQTRRVHGRCQQPQQDVASR